VVADELTSNFVDFHTLISSRFLKYLLLTTDLALSRPVLARLNQVRVVTQKAVFNMSLRRSARVSLPRPDLNGAAPMSTVSKKRAAEPNELKTNGIKKSKSTTTLKSTSTKVKKSSRTESTPDEPVFKVPDVPTTQKRKRASKAIATPIPSLTPTPSLVAAIRAPYSSDDIDGATPPPMNRPVEPHLSNATLVTPGGTQVTAYPFNGIPDSSPSKTGLPRPTGTTGTLLDDAIAHLISVEPRLKPVIDAHPCVIFSPTGLAEEIDPFRSLTSGICGQQVSGAAAKSIKNKFVALFNEGIEGQHVWPSPDLVAKTSIERLRTAGLSQRKAEYIQGLAEKFASGELSARILMRASDEEVMEKLIAVRGLGRWSVEMFACFGLKRMDILSTGDLGVQRGMAAFYGKDVKKLKAKGGGKWKYMSEADMLAKSEPFAPYRSLFMWLMWRVEDVDVSVMNDD
jgi:DNA-3-methyladenine glycosylase II